MVPLVYSREDRFSLGDYTIVANVDILVSIQPQEGSYYGLYYCGVVTSKRAVVDRARRLERNRVVARYSLEVELGL